MLSYGSGLVKIWLTFTGTIGAPCQHDSHCFDSKASCVRGECACMTGYDTQNTQCKGNFVISIFY